MRRLDLRPEGDHVEPCHLVADDRGLETRVHPGHDGRFAEEALVDVAGGRERGRIEVRPPAAVIVLHLELPSTEASSCAKRADRLRQRRVVRGAGKRVQCEASALRDRLAERRARLDEVVEVLAHGQRAGRDEGDHVEKRCGVLLCPGVRGILGVAEGRGRTGICAFERVADRGRSLFGGVAKRLLPVSRNRDEGHGVARDRIAALATVQRDKAKRRGLIGFAENTAEHLDCVGATERDVAPGMAA